MINKSIQLNALLAFACCSFLIGCYQPENTMIRPQTVGADSIKATDDGLTGTTELVGDLIARKEIPEDAKARLERPANCKTAKSDIVVLESERAGVLKQMGSGVRSVLPISAVVALLKGTYSERLSVASGQYNRDIDKKIEEIKTTCKAELK